MSAYKREIDKLKLSEEQKKQVLELYSSEVKKKERSMKRIVKPMVAIAACAAIMLGFVVTGNHELQEQGNSSQQADDHAFSIIVNAEELTEESPVVSYSTENSYGWAICGTEEGDVTFSIGADFSCEGEKIESVTYEIEQGLFQLALPDGTPKIDLREVDVDIATYPSAIEEEGYTGYYADRYTIDYDKQKDVKVAVCGVRETQHQEALFDKATPQEGKAAIDELLGDIKIKCTVTFTDGTTTTKNILLTSKIMTPEEAEPEAVAHDWKLEDPEFEEYAKTEQVYILFELQ